METSIVYRGSSQNTGNAVVALPGHQLALCTMQQQADTPNRSCTKEEKETGVNCLILVYMY